MIEKCKKTLDIYKKSNYTANNIRHTYIDTVYKDGISHGMDIPDIAEIAGNSLRVANKNYRDRKDIELYIETFAKVIISDVDIEGYIYLNESDIGEEINPVKKDLGGCKQKDCVFEIRECLRCKYFYTFLSRIPAFERAIENLDEIIEGTEDPEEIEEYCLEKKLLATYLAKMYEILSTN